MNRIELKYSPYILKLSKPFVTSKGIISERKGMIVSLHSNSGNTGLGDTAPLPEFGSESYEEVLSALNNIDVNFKIDLSNVENSFDEFFSPVNNLPALRHGIEQAFLNLISKEKNISLNQILNRPSKMEIKVNAVVDMIPQLEALKAVRKYIQQGYGTIKLKCGRESFSDDLEIIKTVRKEFPEVNLRIDINGKWNHNEAVDNIKKLEPYSLEYVEQPVKSLTEFTRNLGKTQVPVAADESLRTLKDAYEIIKNKAAGFLILKPMMLGGVIPTLEIIELAEKNGINCIVTSSFESVIGRSFAAFIASLTENNLAHGLDTGRYVPKDLAEDPYPVVNGKIRFFNGH